MSSLPPTPPRRDSAELARTGSPGHFRRRSSTILDFALSRYKDDISASESSRASFDSRRPSLDAEPAFTIGAEKSPCPNGYRQLSIDHARRGSGYFAWRDTKSHRRTGAGACMWVLVTVGCAFAGWLGGLATQAKALPTSVSSVIDTSKALKQDIRLPCNPYDHYGVLTVNTTYEPGNRWDPVMAPPDCEPTDFVTLVANSVRRNEESPEIDFLRNRLIVLFGDSVDRDHNEHMCNFMGGMLELIDVVHPASPPYPKGQEHPPKGYTNPWNASDHEWPSHHQSRPIVCHIYKHNLHILNVFHYGLGDGDDFLMNHPHFYPPAKIEDRFDHIVVPLVETLTKYHNLSSVPEVLSVTNGFWGFLRQSHTDDEALEQAEADGVPDEEALLHHDNWRSLSSEERLWYQRRTTEVLRHVAKGWPVKQENGHLRRPKILWRALHHIKEHHVIPFNRLHAVDQIGRAVVDQLIHEGRAAEAGDSSWRAWTTKMRARLRLTAGSSVAVPAESQALASGLGSRLKLDRWADMLLGQETHFRDNVHPLPVPGSFVYGNSLLHNLRESLIESGEISYKPSYNW